MPAPPKPPSRLDAIDALRGVALAWMTLYHLFFDLNHFGYLRADFYQDPLWTLQRTAILSLFLLCAGAGQAVAVQQGQSWRRFWRRWRVVAGCALLVSAGSWLMYPQSFIYFGVLHGIALMLVIARLAAPAGAWLWLAGLAAIGAAYLGAHALAGSAWADAFNAPSLNWLGLITRKPVTEDYVPLLPWLGVMVWGVAAGRWWSASGAGSLLWRARGPARWLAWMGRHSLLYYMLHQPVLIGTLMGVRALGA